MYKVFLDIGIILIATKIFGTLSQKVKMPQVLGALFAGIIIGPSLLGLVHENESIKLLSELGVIMLMFAAGIETDLEEFKKAGKSSFIIAIGGIVFPLLLGTGAAYLFSGNFYENLFIGVILTATSVSITVQTLNELGKLNTRAGINILGAAVIDDILGLIILAFVLSFANASKAAGNTDITAAILTVVINVVIFIVIAGLAVAFLPKIIDKYTKDKVSAGTITVFAIAAALLCGFGAEEMGIAAITGSYICGLVLSATANKHFIYDKVQDISSYFLAPIFFASVGIVADVRAISLNLIFLTLFMIVVAIAGKLVGCGLCAKFCGMSKQECLQIGAGMVSRGEVALITTNIGLQNGVITERMFVPVLIVVIVTTLITPILLKITFVGDKETV